MFPTFTTGDYVLIRTELLNDSNIERGDVIVFESELLDKNSQHKMLIKRIIGLPGDIITIEKGITYVNHKMYDHIRTSGDMEIVVPEDQFFVLGDNRSVSVDSRSPKVGCVSEDDIVGTVAIRIFPFWRFGFID